MKYDLQTDMNERLPCEMPNNKFAVSDPTQFWVYANKDIKWRFGTISKLQWQLHCEILSDGNHHVRNQSQIKSTLHTTTARHDSATILDALSTPKYVPSEEVTPQTTFSAPQPVKPLTPQPIDIPACTSSPTTSGMTASSENTIFKRNVDTPSCSMKSPGTNAIQNQQLA
jgi:hypothetical protein